MSSKKTKGLFVEVNGFSYLVAAATGLTPPFSIESIDEFPRNEPGKLKEFLDQGAVGKRTRYYNAHCGIIPESRFFRLHTLESMAKAKDPSYFNEILEQQYRINPKGSRTAIVNAQNGRPFMAEKALASQKELLLCGSDGRELNAFQENLVECGVFPQSMQLGTLSGVAVMKRYLQAKEISDSVMLFEVTQHSANLFILSKDKV